MRGEVCVLSVFKNKLPTALLATRNIYINSVKGDYVDYMGELSTSAFNNSN